MGVDATGRAIDNGHTSLVRVARVGWRARCIILVRRDRVTARRDQCWDLPCGVAWCPNLRNWAVVVWLWVAVVEILGCHRSVEARRLLMSACRITMSARIHQVTISPPESWRKASVDIDTGIVGCSGGYQRSLGLGEARILDCHTLKTLRQHIGCCLALLHTIDRAVVAASHLLMVGCGTGIVILISLGEVATALSLVFSHGGHFCAPISRPAQFRGRRSQQEDCWCRIEDDGSCSDTRSCKSKGLEREVLQLGRS